MVGLFPHLPKASTLQFIGGVSTLALVPHDKIAEFFNFFNLGRTPNFCKHQGISYDFPDEVGIPMGSPLSFLTGEVFIHKYERDLFGIGTSF